MCIITLLPSSWPRGHSWQTVFRCHSHEPDQYPWSQIPAHSAHHCHPLYCFQCFHWSLSYDDDDHHPMLSPYLSVFYGRASELMGLHPFLEPQSTQVLLRQTWKVELKFICICGAFGALSPTLQAHKYLMGTRIMIYHTRTKYLTPKRSKLCLKEYLTLMRTRCLLSGPRFDNFHHSYLGFHCLLDKLAIIPSS